jgi:hypothetical protein
VTIDAAEGATFPWAWYFRDLSTGYIDLSAQGAPPRSDVLILTQASEERLRAELGDYTVRRFPFRVWWVREYGRLSLGGWWRWVTKREPWSPLGGMPEWLYVER